MARASSRIAASRCIRSRRLSPNSSVHGCTSPCFNAESNARVGAGSRSSTSAAACRTWGVKVRHLDSRNPDTSSPRTCPSARTAAARMSPGSDASTSRRRCSSIAASRSGCSVRRSIASARRAGSADRFAIVTTARASVSSAIRLAGRPAIFSSSRAPRLTAGVECSNKRNKTG